MPKNSIPVESAPPRGPDVRKGARIKLTVTESISGTITSVQYAGCTHAVTKRVAGETVHTTTHGTAPCPDRNQPIGIMVRPEGSDRGRWVYLTGVPGRQVEIRAEADR
jgi:hypothetical protein